MEMPMQQQQPQQQSPNLEQLHRIAINLVEFFCSIIAMPIEIIIRWQYGTRYFPIPVVFLSTMMMVFLPLLSQAADGVARMIPFHGAAPPPPGMFSFANFASLYFFLSFLHGFRVWRRMAYPELEHLSRWEGPPLPFFYLLPGARSHWVLRILIEPVSLFVSSIFLEHAFIIQSGLATYIRVAAVALVFKNFIFWYRAWEFIRDYLDNANMAPIVAALMQNKASPQDLAKIHLATFPKASPGLMAGVAARIAQAFSRTNSETTPPREGTL
jgi:hypothetical protein